MLLSNNNIALVLLPLTLGNQIFQRLQLLHNGDIVEISLAKWQKLHSHPNGIAVVGS